jgi:hypothetical protein
MSHYKEMLDKLGALETQDEYRATTCLIRSALSRLADKKEEIGLAWLDLHNGGEFCLDASAEAAINGWRRVDGKLPKPSETTDYLWYEKDAPESTDEGAKLVIREVSMLRAEIEAERLLAKRKRERREGLRAAGYVKMWVNPADIRAVARHCEGAFKITVSNDVVTVTQ